MYIIDLLDISMSISSMLRSSATVSSTACGAILFDISAVLYNILRMAVDLDGIDFYYDIFY